VTVLFISLGPMAFLAPNLDNADPFFALIITPCFYLHPVEVADQDRVIVAVYKQNAHRLALVLAIIYTKLYNIFIVNTT